MLQEFREYKAAQKRLDGANSLLQDANARLEAAKMAQIEAGNLLSTALSQLMTAINASKEDYLDGKTKA